MSMTPFSDDFISARVNNIYMDETNEAATGVYVNFTIQMDGNANNVRGYIQSELQKQLLAVVYRRNKNIGNSALYVEDVTGSISALQGKLDYIQKNEQSRLVSLYSVYSLVTAF